jgi:hypothetical protein
MQNNVGLKVALGMSIVFSLILLILVVILSKINSSLTTRLNGKNNVALNNFDREKLKIREHTEEAFQYMNDKVKIMQVGLTALVEKHKSNQELQNDITKLLQEIEGPKEIRTKAMGLY